ncbi:PR domain zinc finger protein 5-like isoform X2 [Ornithodoros turicata]
MQNKKTVRFLFPPLVYSSGTMKRRTAKPACRPHSPKCKFECPTCDAAFTHYIFLAIHTWSHAPQDVRVPRPRAKPCSVYQSSDKFRLQCFLCPLQFNCDTSLQHHIDVGHHDEEFLLRFRCAFCTMRFASADMLISHIQQHDVWEDGDFYPLFGGTVGKASTSDDDAVENRALTFDFDQLIEELKKIAGESDAPKQKSALSRKCKSSSSCNVLRYVCALCTMRFQHGYQVEEHVKLRHKGFLKLVRARHACVYCHAKFYKLSVLRDHLSNHHSISVTPKKSSLRV